MRLIKDVVRKLIKKGTITFTEWEHVHSRYGCNSYEKDAMVPVLDDDMLCRMIAYTVQNCGRRRTPCLTYEDSLQLLALEAAKRLRAGRDSARVCPQCEHSGLLWEWGILERCPHCGCGYQVPLSFVEGAK